MDAQAATRNLTAVQLAEALLSRLKERKHEVSVDILKKIEDILGSSTAAVRNALNSSRPINRIPPEILGLIFQHVPSRMARVDSSSQEAFMWSRASVKATHELLEVLNVCCHWRDVALGQPSLWTSVHDSRRIPEHSKQAYLKRAKALPLKIYVERLPSQPVVELLRSESEWSRIQELHLVDFGQDDASPGGLQGYVKHPANRLQYLTLSATQTSPDEAGAAPPTQPILFAAHAPKLHSLTLDSLYWLPGNEFQNLTHICICHRRTPQEFRPAWGLPDLIALIDRCSNIQEFIFAGIEPRIDHAALAGCVPLSADSLRRISVGKVSPGIAAWLLNHLTNPTGVGIRIFDMICGNRGLLSMLARAAPIHHPVKIGMSMEHDTLRFDAVSETGGVRVESKVNETGRMCDDCTGWIASWWTIWSMNTIKQVWFRSPFDMRMYADHARLLGMLLSLDTMFIGECVGFAVEDSLRPWFQILLTHQLNMSTVPCPALTTLHVWLGKSSINPDIITTFVATRAQLGLPIKRLLVECHEQSPFDKSFDWAVTHPHVDAVEFLVSRTTPGMGLLDSCVTEPHEYWPAW